ncbi:phosphatase PAP2 family protein [Streptomyces sp. SID8379]|uniref:phosphatase PAP2 family protein n=1 Tax=unclassified Streptomyces TaxID=2593676 RepID=UPI00037F8007|nr:MULTISPECIES: phosphatase PAP2 family protein [unclassified Streptomyces]MYW70220.1 phosphatase PAP2 family protein [Streptomyces sp. SID8379]
MNRRDAADLAGSVGLGAWAAFGLLTMLVIGHDGAPLAQDDQVLAWSLHHRPDHLVALARGVTATGTGVIPYVLVILAGLWAGRSVRQRLAAVALGVFCLATGQALRYGLMLLIQRPRPPHADWATHASGWSFPSGHTTTAALAAIAVSVALRVRAPRGHAPLTGAVALWGLAVGLTRTELAVHWSTDVLGGWLFAIGWSGLCLCAASWWLPEQFIPRTTRTAAEPVEGHAAQDPGC